MVRRMNEYSDTVICQLYGYILIFIAKYMKIMTSYDKSHFCPINHVYTLAFYSSLFIPFMSLYFIKYFKYKSQSFIVGAVYAGIYVTILSRGTFQPVLYLSPKLHSGLQISGYMLERWPF